MMFQLLQMIIDAIIEISQFEIEILTEIQSSVLGKIRLKTEEENSMRRINKLIFYQFKCFH